jgi:hypothetical protein
MSLFNPVRYPGCSESNAMFTIDGTNGLVLTQAVGCYSMYGFPAPESVSMVASSASGSTDDARDLILSLPL